MAPLLKFKVGQTVTCADDTKFNRFYNEQVPVLGGFYVIRSVSGGGSSACLRLRSIVNPRHQYTDSFAECSFKASRFLPGKVTMPFFTVRGPLPIATAFAANGVNFDGTNDYMDRTAISGSPASGKTILGSFWLNMAAAGDGLDNILFAASTSLGDSRISIAFSTAGTLGVHCYNSSNTNILHLRATVNLTGASGWSQVLFSADLAATVGYVYVNNVDAFESGDFTLTNDNIDYAGINSTVRLGANSVGAGSKLHGDVAEFYLHLGAFLDLSNATNRQKFINAGHAVDLGATGSTPTGTQPHFFFSGAAATFQLNKGSGGDMAVTGTLTDSATDPP